MKWFPLTVEAFTGHARRQSRPRRSRAAPNPHRLSRTGTACHPRSRATAAAAAAQAGLRARTGSRKPKPTLAAARPRRPSQNRPLRSHTFLPPHHPPRPADIPASKGRKIQPELLWVFAGLVLSRGCWRGPPFQPCPGIGCIYLTRTQQNAE